MLFWGILGCCFSFFFPAEVGGEHWVLAPVPCTRALQVISFIFPILVAPNTSLNSCWSLNPYTQTYLGEYLGLHHLQLCSLDCLQTTRACPKQLNDTKKENFIPEKKKKIRYAADVEYAPHYYWPYKDPALMETISGFIFLEGRKAPSPHPHHQELSSASFVMLRLSCGNEPILTFVAGLISQTCLTINEKSRVKI